MFFNFPKKRETKRKPEKPMPGPFIVQKKEIFPWPKIRPNTPNPPPSSLFFLAFTTLRLRSLMPWHGESSSSTVERKRRVFLRKKKYSGASRDRKRRVSSMIRKALREICFKGGNQKIWSHTHRQALGLATSFRRWKSRRMDGF